MAKYLKYMNGTQIYADYIFFSQNFPKYMKYMRCGRLARYNGMEWSFLMVVKYVTDHFIYM